MERWPVEVEVPVAWGDLDAFGHVNNTVYFRWFETARMQLFLELGVLEVMERDKIGPILASTRCDFRLAVQYPDTVTACAAVQRLGNSSYVMAYQIRSAVQQAVAAEGEGVIVMTDYANGGSVALSEEMRQRLGAFVRPA